LHKKALVDDDPNRWYIQAGVRSTEGYFSKPSLPSVENGGPITKTFEARMRDPSRPSFAGLTLGQWRFVFYDWVSSLVETISEEDVEFFHQYLLLRLRLTLLKQLKSWLKRKN
jgi:hypothetical protein